MRITLSRKSKKWPNSFIGCPRLMLCLNVCVAVLDNQSVYNLSMFCTRCLATKCDEALIDGFAIGRRGQSNLHLFNLI